MRVIPFLALAALCCSLQAEAPKPLRHSPEFQLNFVGGEQKLLSSYRGKVVMLEFIFTTCQHCQHASEVFSKINTQYASRGFQPLAVAWNEMANLLVPDFIKTFKVNYPVAFASREAVLDYLGLSPTVRTVVPQIVWIDRKGMIRSQTSAEAQAEDKMRVESYWHEMVEALTAEQDTTAKKSPPAHRAAVRKPAS